MDPLRASSSSGSSSGSGSGSRSSSASSSSSSSSGNKTKAGSKGASSSKRQSGGSGSGPALGLAVTAFLLAVASFLWLLIVRPTEGGGSGGGGGSGSNGRYGTLTLGPDNSSYELPPAGPTGTGQVMVSGAPAFSDRATRPMEWRTAVVADSEGVARVSSLQATTGTISTAAGGGAITSGAGLMWTAGGSPQWMPAVAGAAGQYLRMGTGGTQIEWAAGGSGTGTVTMAATGADGTIPVRDGADTQALKNSGFTVAGDALRGSGNIELQPSNDAATRALFTPTGTELVQRTTTFLPSTAPASAQGPEVRVDDRRAAHTLANESLGEFTVYANHTGGQAALAARIGVISAGQATAVSTPAAMELRLSNGVDATTQILLGLDGRTGDVTVGNQGPLVVGTNASTTGGSNYAGAVCINAVAAGVIAPYSAVKRTTTPGQVTAVTATTDAVVGFYAGETDTQANQPIKIQVGGIIQAQAGGTINAGEKLFLDGTTAHQVSQSGTGRWVAITAAASAGNRVSIQVGL